MPPSASASQSLRPDSTFFPGLLVVENLLLRQQLAVMTRPTRPRPLSWLLLASVQETRMAVLEATAYSLLATALTRVEWGRAPRT